MTEELFLAGMFGALIASIVWLIVTRFAIYRLEQQCNVYIEMTASIWATLTSKGIVSKEEAIVSVHRAIEKAFKENT